MSHNVNRFMCSVACVAVAASLPVAAFAQDNDADSQQSATGDDTIIVSGVREALIASQDQKRNADNIIDTITFEDIGQYTDENLGDTLARVPGVLVDRGDDGAATFISIRGLGAGFTRTTLNGRTAFGGSGGDTLRNRRSLSLSDYPSELSSGVRVIKSPTADLDEGGIGGIVDIQTLRPLSIDRRRFRDGFLAIGSADVSYFEESDSFDPRLSGVVAFRPTDNLAVLVAGAYRDRTVFTQQSRILQSNTNASLFRLPATGDELGELRADSRANQIAGNELVAETVFRPSNGQISATEGTNNSRALAGAIQWLPTDNFELFFDIVHTESLVDTVNSSLRLQIQGNSSTLRNIEFQEVGLANLDAIITRADVSEGLFGAGRSSGRTFSTADNRTTFDRSEDGVGLHASWTPANGPLTIDIDLSRFESSFTRRNFIVDFDHTNVPFGFSFDTLRNPGAITFDILPGPDGSLFDPLNDVQPELELIGFNAFFLDGSENAAQIDFDYDAGWNIGPFSIDTLQAGAKYRETSADQIRNTPRFRDSELQQIFLENGLSADQQPDLLDFGFRFDFPEGRLLPDLNSNISEFFSTDTRLLEEVFEPLIFNSSLAPAGVREREPAVEAGNQFFRGEEEIISAYFLTDFSADFGPVFLRGNVGLRYTKTDVVGTGITSSTEFTADGQLVGGDPFNPILAPPELQDLTGGYEDFLPSANLIFEIGDNLIFRLAGASVLARPEVEDIAGPTEIRFGIDDDDGDLGGELSGVNIEFSDPNLEPFRADQWDAILEWYPGTNGAFFAVGYFEKIIKNFNNRINTLLSPGDSFTINGSTFTVTIDDIATPDVNEEFNVRVRTTQTVEGSTLRGIELQGHLPFAWVAPSLFGDNGFTRFVSKFGVRGTYTRLFSEDTVLVDDFSGENLPFIGLSDDNYSLIGYYQDGPVSARVSYTFRSEALQDPQAQFGGAAFNDANISFDANVTYRVNRNLSLRLQARSLENRPRRQFIVDQQFPSNFVSRGRQVVLGARVRF